MTFNPKAQSDPSISLEVDHDKAPRTAPKLPVAKPSQAEIEGREQMEHLKNDITCFVFEGRSIRAEVEGLIVWRREMGESSAAPTWGPIQQAHATHWITFQRTRLAKLKDAIEAKRPDVSAIINYIFSEKNRGQYPESIPQ